MRKTYENNRKYSKFLSILKAEQRSEGLINPINVLSESMLHKGFGTLNFRRNNLVVSLEEDFTAYYRKLFGLRNILLKPSFDSHITVAKNIDGSKFQDEKIEFTYSHLIRISGDTTKDRKENFYFLDVWCDRLKEIRKELNLPCWYKFHITIGKIRYE